MPIRGAGDTLEAYRSTKVAVHESQADVRDLLRSRKAGGMQISEAWSGEVAVADVRFEMPAESGGHFAYRIRVRTPDVPVPVKREQRGTHRVIPSTPAQIRDHHDRLERQVWRLVYWWLKAQFEAADAGLIALEEAFLPWMELPDGSTTYETMVKVGGLAKIAAGTVPQLEAGPR